MASVVYGTICLVSLFLTSVAEGDTPANSPY